MTDAKNLTSTRPGYDRETEEGKFFLDAYAGTGGFRGAIKAPAASYWGWAADVYSTNPSVSTAIEFRAKSRDASYLDRHDREDDDKFQRRKGVAHYVNHCAPAIDIPLSYLKRKPLTRTDDEGLRAWIEQSRWNDEVFGPILLRGVVLGSVPTLIDVDGLEAPGETSRAQDVMLGRRVRAVPLFPANVLDYDYDDEGELEWIRLRFDRVTRDPEGGEGKRRCEIRIFDRQSWKLFVLEDESLVSTAEGMHGLGVVPVVSFRPKPLVTRDPILGISMLHDIATEARRHFNLLSELDEHLRSCAFAFLQVPRKGAGDGGAITLGNGNALAVDPESSQPYAWIAPPPSVAATYEERLANTEAAIYFMARLQFAKGQQVSAAASGLSRAYEFETTNRSVADTARALAEYDQAVLRIVAKYLQSSDEPRTTAATSFDVEELDKELATAEASARNRVGATAMAEIRRGIARKMLPNAADETLRQIDEEIEIEAQSEMTARLQADAASGFVPAPAEPPAEEGTPTEEEPPAFVNEPDVDG